MERIAKFSNAEAAFAVIKTILWNKAQAVVIKPSAPVSKKSSLKKE